MSFERLLTASKHSFFLLGMRGTGKSTWAQKTYPKAYRVNLLLESTYQSYLQDPSRFEAELAAQPHGASIIVDEVQRLPQLLNVVHEAIESRKQRFILLGSSARKLRRSGVNLLGGRAEMRTMHPLLPAELGASFSLDKILQYGSVALIWNASSPVSQLKTYMRMYLKEEIQAEALVRNLAGFSRFLPIAGIFHGQVLNVDGLARDAGVARTTVQGYIDILEDTLLAFRLPAFDGKLRVKERSHPKLYWLDNGLARAAKGSLGPPVPEERGVLLESFIVQIVRAYGELGVIEFDAIHYWAATQSSIEVDLLISRGNEITAIEIKAANKIQNDMLKGLRAISQLKNVKRKILIYLGRTRLQYEPDIEVIPVTEFIQMLAEKRV